MTKRTKLRPATSSLWHIYLAARSPAKWIGTIEAVDADAAIAEAAKLFDVNDPQTLVVVRGR